MDHFRVKVARLVVKLAQDKAAFHVGQEVTGGLLAKLEAAAARRKAFNANTLKAAPKVAPKAGPYSAQNRHIAEQMRNASPSAKEYLARNIIV
jgi:hypothetical protein